MGIKFLKEEEWERGGGEERRRIRKIARRKRRSPERCTWNSKTFYMDIIGIPEKKAQEKKEKALFK